VAVGSAAPCRDMTHDGMMSSGEAVARPDVQASFGARYPLFVRTGQVGLWVLAAVMLVQVARVGIGSLWGLDAHAYWMTRDATVLYDAQPGARDAYLYSPAFAQLIVPLVNLPWPAFMLAWFGLELTALWWLVRPIPWRWSFPIALLCLPELLIGNIYLLLAFALVLAMRSPAWWTLSVLTKITPGVGLLWFAVRGDWRKFWAGTGVVGLVVAVSFSLAPALWQQWVEFLWGHRHGASDGGAWALRSALAVVLVILAARARQVWLVPVAALIASPVLAVPTLTLLAAVPRLLLEQQHGPTSTIPEPRGEHRRGKTSGR
jgi:hypothetical protein